MNGIQRLLESQESTKRIGRELVDALDKLKYCVQKELVDHHEEPAEGRELQIGRQIAQLARGMNTSEGQQIAKLADELVAIHSPGGEECCPSMAQG